MPTVKDRIKGVPGQVKHTVTGVWDMIRLAMNPDDPQSLNAVIGWAFGSFSLAQLITAINNKQDLSADLKKWLEHDANKIERNSAEAVINAQSANLHAVLMNPQLILDYFEQMDRAKYLYLNTAEGRAFLDWQCPRFWEVLKPHIAAFNQENDGN